MTSQELLANLLALNNDAAKRTLDGITSEEAGTSPHPDCNSAHFVLGHIATYRLEMAKHLTIDVSYDLGKTFAWGAKDENRAAYPPLAKLHEVLDDVGAKLAQRLATITEEELATEGPYEVPPMPKTIAGVLAFLVFHESYHVGQLGYLRRFSGQDRAFG
jgi:uncharacterized damage-inducible protein DinB